MQTTRFSARTHRLLGAFAVLAVAFALVAVQSGALRPSGDIPNPFSPGSSLQGSITTIGMKNNIPVTNVTFTNGEVSEALPVDTIHFVLVPDMPTISGGASLSQALTSGKRIFGYKYTSANATLERQRKQEVAQGQTHTFAELFPGQFFTSDSQRADGSFISMFEMQNNITFLPLSAVTLDRNARYVIIANDAATSVTVRGLSVAQAGNLFVTAGTPNPPRQLLGGVLGDEILRLTFKADQEDIKVTNVVLSSAQGLSSTVDRLEFYKVGDPNVFATATVGGCAADPVAPNSFCAVIPASSLVIPAGQQTDVIVRPRMRSDVDGALSGQNVSYTLTGVRAQGVTSQVILAANDNDMTAEGEVFLGTATPGMNGTIVTANHRSVLSKLVSILNANPDADGTSVPTGTQRPIGKFKFTAGPNVNMQNGLNKWTLSTILFDVYATNVELNTNSFKIYNMSDMAQKAPCTLVGMPGVSPLVVSCDNLETSGVDTQIVSNTDLTFALQVDVINSMVTNGQAASLQVKLSNFTDASAQATGTNASHVRWLDKDVGAQTQFFWIESNVTSVSSTLYGNLPAVCGNGSLEFPEGCDDGNTMMGDGCSMSCVTESGYTCGGSPSVCAPAAVCGNGVRESAEECDDGNQVNDDSCDNTCKLVAAPF